MSVPTSDLSERLRDHSLYVNSVQPNCQLSNCPVPKSLGHQGVEHYMLRMKSAVWWPGITSQLKQLIQNSPTCGKNDRPRTGPLQTTQLQAFPWKTNSYYSPSANQTHPTLPEFKQRNAELCYQLVHYVTN